MQNAQYALEAADESRPKLTGIHPACKATIRLFEG